MIKKLLFAFIGLSFASAGFAQIPNGGFNSWTSDKPNSWVTVNEIMFMGNPQSAFQETTSFVEGTSALRLETVKLSTNPFASYGIPDTVGIAFTGAINFAGPSLTTGFSYSARPAELNFAYKYAPTGMDTGWVSIMLQKWNNVTMTHDTIATGLWWTVNNTTSYTYQTVPLIYNPLMMNSYPDTAIVLFSSSSYVAPQIGSTLWVDNVSFQGWTGINEASASEAVNVYPNPANETVNFSITAPGAAYIEVYDAAGRKLAETAVWNRKAELSAHTYPGGIYMYRVLNNNREAISKGKFNVSH